MAGKGGDGVRIIIKKKKGGHAAHHGGAWKVAYADFVTAMMALFMVLWLLTQADVKLRSQIARYFRDPGILPGGSVVSIDSNTAHSRDPEVAERDFDLVQSKRKVKKSSLSARRGAGKGPGGESSVAAPKTPKAEQKQLEAAAQAVEKQVRELVATRPELAGLEDQVLIEVADPGLLIQVIDRARSKDLLFDISSAELKAPLVQLLKRIAEALGKLPNAVQVGGHSDAHPFRPGTGKTNWQLSFERADNARGVLEGGGLRAGQLERVLSYADTEPLVPEDPFADENRRLSILAARLLAPPAEEAGATVLPPDQLPAAAASLAMETK
jgi:chemotaxis protein MotB